MDNITAQDVANAVADANFQLFQAMQQSPKALVQTEPRGPSQLVEIQVNQAGLSKQIFPDIQNLRSQVGQVIVIKAIRLITPSVMPVAPISGLANAPLTELVKMAVVLYCEGWEKGELIPILTMNDMFTEGSAEPYRREKMSFDSWKNVDWSKTFLQYANGTPSAGTPYAVILDVEYVKLDSNGVPIIGPS